MSRTHTMLSDENCDDFNFRKELLQCYSDQLMEIELITAMFPNPGEVSFTDPTVLKQVQEFENAPIEFLPNHLDYTVCFKVGQLKLEVCVNLPHLYPNEEPDVMVRCNELNRHEQTKLNSDLNEYMKSISRGDSCIYSLISWVQENAENYKCATTSTEIKKEPKKAKEKFTRYWIYSHHIYNKQKREAIQTYAKEMNLTGFCLPGKPGIVCIEGDEDDCKEWWKTIRSMTWKKIMIRKIEEYEYTESNSQRKFEHFKELHLTNETTKNSKHSDMRLFSKYLIQHGLIDTFNEFFGLCNE